MAICVKCDAVTSETICDMCFPCFEKKYGKIADLTDAQLDESIKSEQWAQKNIFEEEEISEEAIETPILEKDEIRKHQISEAADMYDDQRN